MIDVKIKLTGEGARMPIKGTEHAACYDVYARKLVEESNGVVIAYLGISTEIPIGWKGVIVPRSNIAKTGWIIPNSPCKIDADYRGEWMVKFRATATAPITEDNEFIFPYLEGDRVAQIYFEPVHEVNLLQSATLSETTRGAGGFGSTGTK